LVSVCLSEIYKSGVCISLFEDVNIEAKKRIIWLAVLYWCVGSASYEEYTGCNLNNGTNIGIDFSKNE
jgi:hypothetical protein